MNGLNSYSLGFFVICFCIGEIFGQGGTVYKTIIKEGTGPIPRPNQTVVVHYTGQLENGVKIDSSYDRNEPFRFRLGADEVIRGWDAGVGSMKVGERAKLEIAPEDAYGLDGMPGVIPPNATLTFDIELLAVEDTPGVQAATFSDFPTLSGGTQSFGSQPSMSSSGQTQFPQNFQPASFSPPEPPFFQQPNSQPLEPNIPNLVASNSGFISDNTPQITGGMIPPGPQGVIGGGSFRPGGQTVRSSPVSLSALGVSLPQGTQRSGPAPPVRFISQQQQFNSAGRSMPQTFGSVGGQAAQFPPPGGVPSQGMGQMTSQTGVSQRFNTRQFQDRPPVSMGINSRTGPQMDPRLGMGTPTFPMGNVPGQTSGRAPAPGRAEVASLRALEERILAARRMGLVPGAPTGRSMPRPMNRRPTSGDIMAEMIARQRMGGVGMPGSALPPALRALIAMRRGMGPGPVPPGFPRPRISPMMARRIMASRRLS